MYRRGYSLIDVIFAGAIMCLLFVIFLAIIDKPAKHLPHHSRAQCASNLRQIHTAMYEYSQDYNGRFSMIPIGSGHVVGEDKADTNLKPGGKDDPFKDFSPEANHSISQNMWLLIRKDFAQADIFICPQINRTYNV